MSFAATAVRPPNPVLPRILGGGLLVAVFDALFACTWWWIAADVAPIRILQSIGAGLLGEASFAGGWRSATIGALAHTFIATCMVAVFAFAASRVQSLRLHPWRWGVAYGSLLYVAMTYVVVPLSAAPQNRHPMSWVIASIIVHVLIGVACALIARNAISAPRRRAP